MMWKEANEAHARKRARREKRRYGKSIVDEFWYVGTFEELRKLPLVEIKTP